MAIVYYKRRWFCCSCLLSTCSNWFSPFHAGIPQGMISPGIVPPPGPSPLPHFGTAFGNWESPPFSPNSYRQLPAPGTDWHICLAYVPTYFVYTSHTCNYKTLTREVLTFRVLTSIFLWIGLPSPAAPISPLVSGFPAPNSRPHFQPGFTSGYHVSGSPVGYGSNFSAAPVHIQAPNLNLKVPITNSDQGSAFMVPKMEHPRSANNSPHMAMDWYCHDSISSAHDLLLMCMYNVY